MKYCLMSKFYVKIFIFRMSEHDEMQCIKPAYCLFSTKQATLSKLNCQRNDSTIIFSSQILYRGRTLSNKFPYLIEVFWAFLCFKGSISVRVRSGACVSHSRCNLSFSLRTEKCIVVETCPNKQHSHKLWHVKCVLKKQPLSDVIQETRALWSCGLMSSVYSFPRWCSLQVENRSRQWYTHHD